MPIAGDNCCPVCRAVLWAPASETIGCKKCPRCGAELWVLMGSAPMFFVRQPGQSRLGFLAGLVGALEGVSAAEMETRLQHLDSLDLVEVVVEVEEALRSGAEMGSPDAAV
jgi:hypothetical protein